MSLIETPPPNRQPVETIVCAYDERVIRDAIERELARGGQVFVLHNRVRTIGRLAGRIGELCPDARIAIGHGQMEEGELEPVMESFVAGRTDVLVSTTIIESGLDIPNANTIIIDRADMFGMADLYQLRGRVGRSGAKAYAYLMLPRDLMGAARKRVSAIKQYSELGSGFRIAMRDLELRGAGNMLGTAQSGHILAVGFDLYCRMLRRAVDAIAGKKRFARAECAVRIDFVVNEESAWPSAPEDTAPAFVPHSYVGDSKMRIACYRQLAEAEEPGDLEKTRREWRDRFGPLPRAAENALTVAHIAIAGAARRLTTVETRNGRLQLSRRTGFIQPGGKFPRLTASNPDSRLREVLKLIKKLEE
jgi:transcription-repair coupling factor (superfamily II helicase)